MTTRTHAKFGVRTPYDVSGNVHRRDAAHVVSLHHTTHVVTPPPAIVVAGVSVTGLSRLLMGLSDVVIATARTSAGAVISGKTFAFTSSNPAAVTIGASGGAVRSIAPRRVRRGPVTITASSGGKSGSVRRYVVSDSGLYVVTTGGVAGDPVTASIDIPNATSPMTFTATFSAPSTAGTIYFQVSEDGAVARLLFPIVFRGQTMRTITVQ